MKISIENYGRIHTTFVDAEDCSIEEYIDIIYNLLIANGFHSQTVINGFKEFLESKENEHS
jgi:hypothetical protein